MSTWFQLLLYPGFIVLRFNYDYKKQMSLTYFSLGLKLSKNIEQDTESEPQYEVIRPKLATPAVCPPALFTKTQTILLKKNMF